MTVVCYAPSLKNFPVDRVGVETLAASVSEETETVEDVYEPFLMQLGFLQRTPRGRMVTSAAYDHLGLTRPEGNKK